jgi:hypothetical protein
MGLGCNWFGLVSAEGPGRRFLVLANAQVIYHLGPEISPIYSMEENAHAIEYVCGQGL